MSLGSIGKMATVFLGLVPEEQISSSSDIPSRPEQRRKSAQVSNGHSYPLLNALTLEAHLQGKLDISSDTIALSRAERSLQAPVKDEPPYNAPWSHFDLAQIRLF
jgi:hypothetical protein